MLLPWVFACDLALELLIILWLAILPPEVQCQQGINVTEVISIQNQETCQRPDIQNMGHKEQF